MPRRAGSRCGRSPGRRPVSTTRERSAPESCRPRTLPRRQCRRGAARMPRPVIPGSMPRGPRGPPPRGGGRGEPAAVRHQQPIEARVPPSLAHGETVGEQPLQSGLLLGGLLLLLGHSGMVSGPSGTGSDCGVRALTAVGRWLERELDGTAPGIHRVVEAWVRILLDGGPRSEPRSRHTRRVYLGGIQLVLLEWSSRYSVLWRRGRLLQPLALGGGQGCRAGPGDGHGRRADREKLITMGRTLPHRLIRHRPRSA